MDIKKIKVKYSFPYLVWMAVLIIAPLLMIGFYAITLDANSEVIFSLENIKRAFEPIYMKVLLRSVLMALASTAICLLLGYPIAVIISGMPTRKAGLLSMLFILPMWMNFLLRTYAWMAMLDTNGLINRLLGLAGIGPLPLMYNTPAVLMGMVYNFLPFMILPIYNVLQKIPKSQIEAAQDLGADDKAVFRRIIFPLTIPGVVTGITMVFIPGITTFAISRLLGGAQFMMYGDLIENQFLQFNDPHFGSALSIIMMVLVFISTAVMKKFDADSDVVGI